MKNGQFPLVAETDLPRNASGPTLSLLPSFTRKFMQAHTHTHEYGFVKITTALIGTGQFDH